MLHQSPRKSRASERERLPPPSNALTEPEAVHVQAHG